MLRLPFDQYQRYRLVAEAVSILEGEGPALTVLEVGGWPPKLGDFLPGHQVTVTDVIAQGAANYVRAEGGALPFRDRSFGLVVSLDTLEHVPAAKRPQFIADLCRVAAESVIIAAPFAADATRAADRAIFEFVRGHAGYEHPFLREHLELEAPDLVNTLVLMVDRGLDVQVVPSGRLDRWLFMMAAYYALDADPNLHPSRNHLMEAYNRAFYDFDKAEPAYRHFLIGAHEGLGHRWAQLAQLASGDSVDPDHPDYRAVTMVIELARVLALKQKDRERDRLLADLAQKDDELAALKKHVAALEDFMAKVKSLPLYSFYEKFLKPFAKR